MAQSYSSFLLSQFDSNGSTAASSVTYAPIGIDKNQVLYWQAVTAPSGSTLNAPRISFSSTDGIKNRTPLSRIKTRLKMEIPHVTTSNGIETVVSSAFVNLEFNYPYYWTLTQRAVIVENLIRLLTNNSPYGPTGTVSGSSLTGSFSATNQVVEAVLNGSRPY